MMLRRPATSIAAGLIVATAVALSFVAGGHADKGATGIVKTRMDAMSDMQRAMKEMGSMVRGQQAFAADTVRRHAAAMRGHAERMGSQYPAGSHVPPSEASVEIWNDAAGFNAAIDDFRGAVSRLEAVVSEDQFKPAFQEVGGSCRTCHKRFRIEKK